MGLGINGVHINTKKWQLQMYDYQEQVVMTKREKSVKFCQTLVEMSKTFSGISKLQNIMFTPI